MQPIELAPLPSWDGEATWRTFEDGSFHQYVHGVELQKSTDDLARYADLIEASQPDVVIETGTRRGGSALWFAQQGLQVITIDREPGAGTDGRKVDVHEQKHITWWSGHDSLDVQVAAAIQRQIKDGQRVMVSLDSDHHMAHVIGEISMWAPFVTRGCYLVIEDACFDMWPAERAQVGGYSIPKIGGPLGAIRRCLPYLERGGFWRDTAIEGLSSVSHSPVGWWRNGD